jgi:hypothetical protein
MSRRERNAADLKSGNAVSHSAPVLNQPTSPKQPVESRRLSSVQPKSGRGLGQSPMSAEGALPLSLLDGADVARLIEFFLLLDAWDRRAMASRSCSQCDNPAAFSLCNLLSTVAVNPRQQKCGSAILYCFPCIQ